MGPLLDALRELGGEGRPRDVEEIVARTCGVTDEERLVRSTKGALKFANQVAWCRQYLIYENLISCPERGVWKLTDSGRQTNLAIEQARGIVRRWAGITRRDVNTAPERWLMELLQSRCRLNVITSRLC